MKLLQQASSICDVFHVSLLELYVSDGHTALEPTPPIEIDGTEGYELKEILPREYRHVTMHYRVKYNRYSAKQSEWLLAENLAHAQDKVSEFHALHLNQPKPAGLKTQSHFSAVRHNTNTAKSM